MPEFTRSAGRLFMRENPEVQWTEIGDVATINRVAQEQRGMALSFHTEVCSVPHLRDGDSGMTRWRRVYTPEVAATGYSSQHWDAHPVENQVAVRADGWVGQVDTTPSRVHVHRPGSFTYREVRRCRRCRQGRRHMVTIFVWYGPMTTCCHCGARTNDGHLYRRRVEDSVNAQRATRQWRTAATRRDADVWLLETLEETFPQPDPQPVAELRNEPIAGSGRPHILQEWLNDGEEQF